MPAGNVIRLKPVRPCPVCKKPSSQAYHPFCSARCEDIDLNRWLSGAYVIPAKESEESQEEDGATLPDQDGGEDDV